MLPDKVWSIGEGFAICEPLTLRWWSGKDWSDQLGAAKLYATHEKAVSAAERSPFIDRHVVVLIELSAHVDGRKHVLGVREQRAAERQRPLF